MSLSKYTKIVAAAAAAVWLPMASVALGQDVQQPRPQQRETADEGPQRARGGPPGFALQESLDKDGDGKLSADEIKAATASLKALDRNSDGKLDAAEIGWPPQFGGPGRGRGGRGGRGRGGFGGPGGAAPVEFDKRIMSRDANRDGKVSADELPRSMRRVVQLADANKDGAIDEKEAEKFAKEFGAIGRGRQ